MRRLVLVQAVCVSLVLVGCEVDTGPQRVATLRHPGLALVMQAPYDGRYILYQLVRRPPGITNRDYVDAMHLNRGQPLGFRQGGPGTFAVAGTTEIPLARGGNYDWVMQADPHQIDGLKTIVIVASAVLVGAAIAVTAYEWWRDTIKGK